MPHDAMGVGLYVIFGIILLPVYAMVAGWVFGKPRVFPPVIVAAGYLIVLSGMIVFGLWLLGVVTSIVVPF